MFLAPCLTSLSALQTTCHITTHPFFFIARAMEENSVHVVTGELIYTNKFNDIDKKWPKQGRKYLTAGQRAGPYDSRAPRPWRLAAPSPPGAGATVAPPVSPGPWRLLPDAEIPDTRCKLRASRWRCHCQGSIRSPEQGAKSPRREPHPQRRLVFTRISPRSRSSSRPQCNARQLARAFSLVHGLPTHPLRCRLVR